MKQWLCRLHFVNIGQDPELGWGREVPEAGVHLGLAVHLLKERGEGSIPQESGSQLLGPSP